MELNQLVFIAMLKENKNPSLNLMKMNTINKLCDVLSFYSFTY